uniref:DNA polymerase n=1 Tax=Hanusia phi TaxID=3032 RepID=A0A7S0H8G1_9CRYP|mmetsp:Transcript_10889/g.24725  ORF Transcript_10889/g.24725 Transcript_10889/m.24725 type:complete len:807 (+) Transcript_10889:1-2421(+)
MAWQRLVVHELDLDLLTGHNIFKFDLNYIARRAQVLKLPQFFELGRMKGRYTAIKTTDSQSKAFGHNQFHYLPMTGRMQMDIYQVMTKQHKLSSYKLDSLAKHFLGMQKDDVSPKQIFEFQVKDAFHRGIVAKYCAKDCELVYRLIERLDILPQFLEMSKVTGVTMNDLNTRGQQIKVFTQIVREARASDFVIPDMRASPTSRDDVQYQGAFVLPPQRGIYHEPIATLDFASLYPSIIRGDNLSYETLVQNECEIDKDTPVSCIQVDHGAIWDAEITIVKGSNRCVGALDDVHFVKLMSMVEPGMKIVFGTSKKTDPVVGPIYQVKSAGGTAIELVDPIHHVERELTVKRIKLLKEYTYKYVQHVEGILPRICKNLLTARKKAKKEMALTDDPIKKGLLNGKQLALKVSCNSVYGFTGASKGMLPCLPIASSVTAIGQQMIKTTSQTVQENFNATVIYGDTDSVMVNFHCGEGPEALKKALELGQKAAKLVTSKFKPPNELEFEKVYMPYILYNKKRYAGQMYTSPDKPDKIDVKGLQVVRRDNSELQRDLMKNLIKTMVKAVTQDELICMNNGTSKLDVVKSRISDLVRSYNQDLVQGNFPLEKYVISQSISKKGYEKTNAAGFKSAALGHVKLAERMEKREPGTGPVAGDRVHYIIVKEAPHLSHIKNRTIDGVTYAAKDWPPRHERCEDPAYVREKNLTVDLAYYLENQLKNPVTSLLEPVYDKSEELFLEAERNLKSKLSGNLMLTSFFSPRQTAAVRSKVDVKVDDGKKEKIKGCASGGTRVMEDFFQKKRKPDNTKEICS